MPKSKQDKRETPPAEDTQKLYARLRRMPCKASRGRVRKLAPQSTVSYEAKQQSVRELAHSLSGLLSQSG